jgi:hypothetical protein
MYKESGRSKEPRQPDDIERSGEIARSAESVMSDVLEKHVNALRADAYGEWSDDDLRAEVDLGVGTLATYVAFLKGSGDKTPLTAQEQVIVDAYCAARRYIEARCSDEGEVDSVEPSALREGGYVYEAAVAKRNEVKGIPGKMREYSKWSEIIRRIGILDLYKSAIDEGQKDDQEYLGDECADKIYPWITELADFMSYLVKPIPRRLDAQFIQEKTVNQQLFSRVRQETINMGHAANVLEFITETVRYHRSKEETSEAKQHWATDQAQKNKTSPESEEGENTIVMPQDWKERQDFIKDWFAQHDPNDVTPENLEVARKYFAQEIEMQAEGMRNARKKRPDMNTVRYVGNIAGIFGSGYSVGRNFEPVDIVVVRKLQKDGIVKTINTAEYAALRIDVVAETIGLDVYELTKDYDTIFQ